MTKRDRSPKTKQTLTEGDN